MRRHVLNEAVRFDKLENANITIGNSYLDLDTWVHALRMVPTAAVTESDVLAWAEGPLRGFFPFEKFWGGYGSLSNGRMLMRPLITSGHSEAFIAGLQNTLDLKWRGSFEWWVSNRKAFILDKAGARDVTGKPIHATKRELEEVERFSLGIAVTHGVIDPVVNSGTYFSFSGVQRAQVQRVLTALDLIGPVLHDLFRRVKRAEKSSIDPMVLTDRQRELVGLASVGLTDRAIASRLEISDNTVGNHFRAIYAKLGIRKRSQLIALLK